MAIFAAGLAILSGGCDRRSDSKLRYKLIVEVDTPSGVKSGASVLETDMDKKAFTYGQAPYVDLGNGRYVFALLDNQFGTKPMYSLAIHVLEYPELQPRLDPEKHLFVQAKDSQPKGIVRREDYPMLVTFDDINDPKTVREVDPSAVKRITFQVVDQDEPLTVGLEDKFAWALDGNHTLSGDRYGKVANAKMLAEQIYANSFVWRKK